MLAAKSVDLDQPFLFSGSCIPLANNKTQDDPGDKTFWEPSSMFRVGIMAGGLGDRICLHVFF